MRRGCHCLVIVTNATGRGVCMSPCGVGSRRPQPGWLGKIWRCRSALWGDSRPDFALFFRGQAMIDQAQDERAIFFAALERPAGPERDAYLREACSGESDLLN